jgi:hypothetical protein
VDRLGNHMAHMADTRMDGLRTKMIRLRIRRGKEPT